MGHGNSIGTMIPEGWYTRHTAADLIGCSVTTLRNWERSGKAKPSGSMQVGRINMGLYSLDDIEALRVVDKK